MPSAKPDSNEINALRKKRGFNDGARSADLYVDLHEQCAAAVRGGYVTHERASVLFQFLQANPYIASIYPNNVLTHLLTDICADGGWNSEFEHDLLNLIYSLYLGYERAKKITSIGFRISIGERGITTSCDVDDTGPRPPMDIAFALADAKLQTPRLKAALLSEHLNRLTEVPDLTERFIGFTGKFQHGSRAICFSEARKRGAVPCGPAPFLDYLFVSSEFEERGVISSKLDIAIFDRRVYGSPLILSEELWNCIVSST
jgi:hypothetical protein